MTRTVKFKVCAMQSGFAVLFLLTFCAMLAMLSAAAFGIPAGIMLSIAGVAVKLFNAQFAHAGADDIRRTCRCLRLRLPRTGGGQGGVRDLKAVPAGEAQVRYLPRLEAVLSMEGFLWNAE